MFLFLAYGLIFGFFCAYLAGEKGRDGGSWFFLGLFFGILALLVLIGLPSDQRSSVRTLRVSRQPATPSRPGGGSIREGSSVRLCPHCIEEVHELATACPHCQRDLPEVERCSFRSCNKIINPSDQWCEDEQGHVYCSIRHKQRQANPLSHYWLRPK